LDCGSSNAVRFVTMPFLRSSGVNQLSRLALTHGDLQDVGGTELLRAGMPVAEIATSAVRYRSPVYRQILRSLEESQSPRRVLRPGDRFAGWQVLHPAPDDKSPQADDACLVMMGRFHTTRILLLSDLGRPGQETLMHTTNDLRAEIVVTGLPEKGEPLCDALLERIQPKLILVADSEYPAPARAGKDLQGRLAKPDVKVIYTRDAGAVRLTIDQSRWQSKAARQPRTSE
jgi:beta-lactamase superfamily II metal-dependent hydrolase